MGIGLGGKKRVRMGGYQEGKGVVDKVKRNGSGCGVTGGRERGRDGEDYQEAIKVKGVNARLHN